MNRATHVAANFPEGLAMTKKLFAGYNIKNLGIFLKVQFKGGCIHSTVRSSSSGNALFLCLQENDIDNQSFTGS